MYSVHPARMILQCLQTNGRIVLPLILLALSLSCGWGPRQARVPRPEPTRIPQPTFTPTPLPPTHTPVPTDTPVLPANTPLPTDTPPPATETPIPSPTLTDTPVPPTPIPPTATPIPPAPTSLPPSPSPTFTTVPATSPPPAIRFELGTWWKENNCYDLGVYGIILDAQGNLLKGITIEIIGEEETYTATSDGDGEYDIHLGSLLDHADGASWTIQLKENGQIVSQKIEWTTSQDCDDTDKIQILHLEWKRKS